MTEPGSPTVRRRRLAAELREIRESRGRSGESVAAALGWSPSKISRYERAKTGLRPREVERLLSYYQVTGQRRALLLALAEDATHKGWWEDSSDVLAEDYKQFIGLEHEANSIAIWHVDVVAGLLQTEAYARHIIGSYSRIEPVPPGMIGRLVRVRMQRQQVLDRPADHGLAFVLDEQAEVVQARPATGGEGDVVDRLLAGEPGARDPLVGAVCNPEEVWQMTDEMLVALAPILIIWFGFGTQSKVAVVFIMVVFPMIINTQAGLESVDRRLLLVARSLCGNDRKCAAPVG